MTNEEPQSEGTLEALAALMADRNERRGQQTPELVEPELVESEPVESEPETYAFTTEERENLARAVRIRKVNREQERLSKEAAHTNAVIEAKAVRQVATEAGDDAMLAHLRARQAKLLESRSKLPTIPTVSEAAGEGITTPSFDTFSQRILPQQSVMPLPDLELPEYMTQLDVLVYGLVPAFAQEHPAYLQKFMSRPTSLVRAWKQALGMGTNGIDGERWIAPHELRWTANKVATKGVPMNPRAMAGFAKEAKDNQMNWEPYKADVIALEPNKPVVFQSVLLSTPKLAVQPQVSRTKYPETFPYANLSDEQMRMIDQVLSYRNFTEPALDRRQLDWLTETLLVIVGLWNAKKPELPTMENIFLLAYRFSSRYIRRELEAGDNDPTAKAFIHSFLQSK